MPRVADSSSSWSIDKLSNMMWSFFNVAYLFFRTLIDPLLNVGSNSQSSRSRSSYGSGGGGGGGGGPPRPPGRRNFATFSDTISSPGYFPPPGG